MKRRNRLTAVLTAGVMSVLCAVPVPGNAYGEKVTVDGISYEIYDGHATAYKIDASLTNAVVLNEVEGAPVLMIADWSDGERISSATLQTITIPENVEYVVLNSCPALTEVTVLGDCFAGISIHECPALERMNFSNPSYEYKDHMLCRDHCLMNYYKHGAESLTIPADVTSVAKSALEDFVELKEITVMNPECYIPDHYATNVYHDLSNLVIHGYENSTAHRYALVNGNKFVSLGKSMTTPSTPTGSTGYAPADLDGNGTINAADAASILLYAAYVGAGGTDDIMTFLAAR